MEVSVLGTTKKPSSRRPLGKFYDLFDVKQRTAVHQLGDAYTKRKEIRKEKYLWYTIQKQKGYTKINAS